MVSDADLDGFIQEIIGAERVLVDVDSAVRVPAEVGKDAKFELWCDGKPIFLLKISDLAEADTRRWQFAAQRWAKSACPTVQRTVAFGLTSDGGHCYYVIEFIPGETVAQVLPSVDAEAQYELGVAAGRALLQLHNAKLTDVGSIGARKRAQYRRDVARLRKAKVYLPAYATNRGLLRLLPGNLTRGR